MYSLSEATLIFQRVDGQIIQDAMIDKDIKLVNSLLVKSFKTAKKSIDGKWFEDIEKEDVYSILHLEGPLKASADRKTRRFTFEYTGADANCMSYYWYPMELGKWLGWEMAFATEDQSVELPYCHCVRPCEDAMNDWMKPQNLSQTVEEYQLMKQSA